MNSAPTLGAGPRLPIWRLARIGPCVDIKKPATDGRVFQIIGFANLSLPSRPQLLEARLCQLISQ